MCELRRKDQVMGPSNTADDLGIRRATTCVPVVGRKLTLIDQLLPHKLHKVSGTNEPSFTAANAELQSRTNSTSVRRLQRVFLVGLLLKPNHESVFRELKEEVYVSTGQMPLLDGVSKYSKYGREEKNNRDMKLRR